MEKFAPIVRAPNENEIRISVEAICHKCPDHRRTVCHRVEVSPLQFNDAAFAWQLKHPPYLGHTIEFRSPKRSIPRRFADWLYRSWGIDPWYLIAYENSDLKTEYSAVATVTITLASLASSTTWVAGRQSTVLDNSSTKYIDYRFDSKITTGTTPTVNTEIRMYGIKPLNDDTAVWPDTFGGSDAAVTVTNTEILNQLPLLQATRVTATSNIAYPLIKQQTFAEAYGWAPKNLVVFVSHATVAALNATGGNHLVYGQGIYFTSLG